MPAEPKYDPTIEKTLKFQKLANEFDNWMDNNNHFNQSDMELLFSWLDSDENSRGVKKYEDFLTLAQAVGALGYTTTLDVPLSEEDFANRKVADSFESWLKKSNQPLMRCPDYLLAWIDKGDGSRHITGYQHFLQLVQTLVKRGYKASVDIPISETQFKQVYDIRRETIFLEIVKKFLVKEIKEARNGSLAADSSMTNALLSRLKLGRDEELSKNKRELADDLLFKLQHVNDIGSDLKNCNLLKSLVAECKQSVRALSEFKGSIDGKFEQTMTTAMSLIQNIYDKLEKVQLLDIILNDDPFNQFRYYMALYFSQNLIEAESQSFGSYLSSHLKITSSLSAQNEELILRVLKECALDLETLDKDHDGALENRRKWVVDHIDLLSQKIKEVDEDHSPKSLTVSVGFFSMGNITIPSPKQKVGYLLNCLLNAQKEICSERDNDSAIEFAI